MMAKTKNRYPTSFDTYYEFQRVFNSIPEKDRLEWAESLDPKLLRMKDSHGWTVAHVLAKSGTLPEKFITDKLLRMKYKYRYGWAIAHELAEKGILPKKWMTEELLRVKCGSGRTVAHVLAELGTFPKELITDELLRIKTDYGLTVAHVLAYRGTLPERFITEELLRMKDNISMTVAGCYFDFLSENNRWDLLTPMLFSIPYRNETTMIDKVAKYLSGMNDVKLEGVFSLMPGETQMKLLSDIKNPDLLERIRKCLDREMESEAFETPPDGEQDIHSEERESLYCGVRSDR